MLVSSLTPTFPSNLYYSEVNCFILLHANLYSY